MTLDAMEVLVIEQGRELLRGVVQLAWTPRPTARSGWRG